MTDQDPNRWQLHVMQLVQMHEGGIGEWHCPICGRRFLLGLEPFRKQVIEKGDESAPHCGGEKGIVLSGDIQLLVDALQGDLAGADPQDSADVLGNYLDLAPWIKWMKDVGLA